MVKTNDPIFASAYFRIDLQSASGSSGDGCSLRNRPEGLGARLPGGRKTGTEKINPENGQRWQGRYIVSFIGAAPINDPEVMIYSVVDEPNVDDQTQGGYPHVMSRKILMEILPYLNIPVNRGIYR